MGHLAIRAGAEVRFRETSRILADLAGGHADRTFDKRLASHVKPDLLILDDVAMREFSPTQADDLYELISQRVAEGRSIAITANRAPQDWYPLFPNAVVAESLLGRLINTGHQVFMNGPGFRPNKRPKNTAAKDAVLTAKQPSCDHVTVADMTSTETEHAVVARFQLTGDGFGLDEERAAIYQAQRCLTDAIADAGVGEFDGNEFGSGTVVLYAYGPDADALFAVMRPMLRELPFRPAHVVLRYGSASDPLAAERRVDL